MCIWPNLHLSVSPHQHHPKAILAGPGPQVNYFFVHFRWRVSHWKLPFFHLYLFHCKWSLRMARMPPQAAPQKPLNTPRNWNWSYSSICSPSSQSTAISASCISLLLSVVVSLNAFSHLYANFLVCMQKILLSTNGRRVGNGNGIGAMI